MCVSVYISDSLIDCWSTGRVKKKVRREEKEGGEMKEDGDFYVCAFLCLF